MWNWLKDWIQDYYSYADKIFYDAVVEWEVGVVKGGLVSKGLGRSGSLCSVVARAM